MCIRDSDNNVVPGLRYGNFQADANGFSVISPEALFVPNQGVAVAGFGATNLGILPNDFNKQKTLIAVGINTYFARSVLDVGAATTTNNSYFIPPSVTSGELEIIANLWTGKIVGYGTVRAKQVTPDGVPGGSLVYNRTNSRLEVGIGTTTFCGIATLTNNHTGYSAYVPPYVNTEQRAALTNAGIASGAIIFNPLNKRLEMYKDAVTGWVGIATGSTNGAVSLDDLIDVEVPYPNDKDSLVWNAGASKWVSFNVGTGRFISNDTGISTNTNLGIGTTTASSALTVSGDGIFTGVVTATSFIGSGANLTGVGTQGLNVQAQSLTVAGISTFHNNIKIGTGVTIESNGDATYTGIVTAGSFVGDGSGLTGVGTQGINGQFRGLVVAGVSTLGVTSISDLGVEELNVTGISTFTTCL